MATINYAAREINVKVVYYGPALSGKTTNLQIIHKKVPQESKSDMVSLATESDRTLFFDFLPIDLGKIKGFTTKIQLYTVPGQVYYNATRKLVLRGVDGIVFVADSSASKLAENLESLDNMEENLAEYGYSLKTIPIVLQYNKRDCEDPMSIAELDGKLNRYGSKCVPAVARMGEGVFDTLKVISKEVIGILNKKYEGATASSSDSSHYSPPPTMRQTTQIPTQQRAASNYDNYENYESDIDMPEYKSHTQKIPQVTPPKDDFSDFLDIPQTSPTNAAPKSNASFNPHDIMDSMDAPAPAREAPAAKPSYDSDFGLGLDDEIAPAPVKPAASPATAASNYNDDLDFAFDDVSAPPAAHAAPIKPAASPAPAASAYNDDLDFAFDDVSAPPPAAHAAPIKPAASPTPAVSNYDEISLDDNFDSNYQPKYTEKESHASQTSNAYDTDIKLGAVDDPIDSDFQQSYQPKESPAKETANAYGADIQLDDAYDSPIDLNPKPTATPAHQQEQTRPATTIIPSVNRVIETPMAPPTQHIQTVQSPPPPIQQAQPVQPTPPPVAQTSPILEDVLEDAYNTPPPRPAFQAGQMPNANAADPIRAAFQNKRPDSSVPPEKMMFTSMATDPKKAEHLIAAKKKPVNPKYKKSLLENLFKKQQTDKVE